MDSRKNMGVIGTVVAVIVAVVGVSVVWAAYTTSLTINGKSNIKGIGSIIDPDNPDEPGEEPNWSIEFSDLSEGTKTVLGNTVRETSTASFVDGKTPKVTGTTIEEFEVNLKTPGDFVTYTFQVENKGNIPALIDNKAAYNWNGLAKTCTSEDSNVSANKVCESIVYSLTYGSGSPQGAKLAKEGKNTITLKVQYMDNISEENLPTKDVTVQLNTLTIPFVADLSGNN